MRTPSIKTLARVFENPELAKSILLMKHAELRAQPVFQEFDGLMFQRIGFAPGPEKRGDTWLSYRRVSE